MQMLFHTLIRECQVLREYNNDDKHLLADPKGSIEALWETKHEVPVNAEKREKEEQRASLAVLSFFCFCAHPPPPPPIRRPKGGLGKPGYG